MSKTKGYLESNRVMSLPVGAIRPNPAQPRRIFDDDGLQELARSIASCGIIQPLTVRRVPDGYELVDVTAEGSYKNLKGPADTGVENGYRLTKVAGAAAVTVTVQPTAPAEPIETPDLHIYSSISVGTDMIMGFTARKALPGSPASQ